MRRASIYLALLGLVVLGVPAVATAAPKVTLKAKYVPIPGIHHSGNILGAPAAAQIEWTISGTEYGGFPAPLIGINTYSPAGQKVTSHGFVTCSPSALENVGPKACPKKSKVTLAGSANGVVSFGNERVEEKVLVEGFFAPGGKLTFFTQGVTPVALEFLSNTSYTNTHGAFAQKFISDIPLVETVPGAPDASTLSITVRVGYAFKKHKKVVSYLTVPKRCKHGLQVKSEMIFANTAALPSKVPGETVTSSYKAPCPRKK
jgi:hypothetical protein